MARTTQEHKIDPTLVSKHFQARRHALREAVSKWKEQTTAIPTIEEAPKVIVGRLADQLYPADHLVVDEATGALICEGGAPNAVFSAPIKGDMKLLALVMDSAPFELNSSEGCVQFIVYAHQDPNSLNDAIETARNRVRDYLNVVNAAVQESREEEIRFASGAVEKHLAQLKAAPSFDAALAELGIKKRDPNDNGGKN